MNIIKKFSTFEKTYFLGGILLLSFITIAFHGSYIALFSAISSIIAAALNGKMIRQCFWFYILGGLSYIIIAYQSRLYGEVILYIFYQIPICIRGLVFWKKSAEKRVVVEVFSLAKKQYVIIAVLAVGITIGYGYVLSLLGTNLPYLNSLATFCLVTASYLAAKKYKEQWFFWMSYTLVLIVIWFFVVQNDITMFPFFSLGFIFIGINLIGMRSWNRMYKYLMEEDMKAVE
jgi:nicotinamide mononucleotide transporter